MVTPPSAEYIYNDLVRRIVDLELAPGSKISENKIGEEYNVSRSVIRNVFARLSQAHFVEVYPQRGTFVTKINLEYIHNILIMRLAIEKEMLVRFMRLDNRGEIVQRLQENVKKQQSFGDHANYIGDFRKLDEEFHGIIMISVEKYNILSLMNEHLLHLNRWRNLCVSASNNITELIHEHEMILKGIETEDDKLINRMIEIHIETAFSTAGKWIEKYADYFEPVSR